MGAQGYSCLLYTARCVYETDITVHVGLDTDTLKVLNQEKVEVDIKSYYDFSGTNQSTFHCTLSVAPERCV